MYNVETQSKHGGRRKHECRRNSEKIEVNKQEFCLSRMIYLFKCKNKAGSKNYTMMYQSRLCRIKNRSRKQYSSWALIYTHYKLLEYKLDIPPTTIFRFVVSRCSYTKRVYKSYSTERFFSVLK